MYTREDVDRSCATFLKALRLSLGLSKSKIADRFNLNRKRWAAYETGEDQPSISEFFYICQQCGVVPAQPILEFYEPDIYSGLAPDTRVSKLRQAAAHYVLNVATNREIKSWYFQVRGHHGSDYRGLMAEVDMICQLSMGQRYMIAEMVDAFWTLDAERGELRNTDEITPDVEYFRACLQKGRQATVEGKDAYAMPGF